MDDTTFLAERFEQERTRLRSVAYRMLGSTAEADDAVQEAWLRLSRADATTVENLPAWLTTVVSRVCLNMLRSRTTRRESPLVDDPLLVSDHDPEEEAVLADSVGLALLVVLDTLTPAERLAFVLHDLFDLPFDEVAPIVGRTPAAARQLASRARRRVRGVRPDPDLARQRRVADAYLAAIRNGDFEALMALLDPDVELRADATANPAGRAVVLHGSDAVVAGAIASGARARYGGTALVDGSPGLIMVVEGRLVIALAFSFDDDTITGIDVIADPDRLAGLDIAVLEN